MRGERNVDIRFVLFKGFRFYLDCYVKNRLKTMGNSDGLEWREVENIETNVGGRINRFQQAIKVWGRS